MDMNGEMIKMMKRKWFKVSLMTFGILFLPLIGYLFYFCVWDSSTAFLLSEAELKRENFLQDKQAIVYFSTTVPQNAFNDGLSYAVFVDDQGRAKSWKMDGLELGSMAAHSNQVFVEEKEKVRLVGNRYQVFPMKDKQFTGERTGYLEKGHFFYSIYNSGFDERGGYRSDVRWGNDKGFQTGTIPYYIRSSGEDGEHFYILTMDFTKDNKCYLKEINIINQKVEIKSLTEWRQSENSAFLSSILADEHYFYVVLYGEESDFHVQLLQINKQNYQMERYTLVKYPPNENDDTLTNLLPLGRESLHLYNRELYYVDGFGDIYTFNPLSKKVQKKFSLLDYKPTGGSNDEQLYFHNQYMYIFRFNPSTGQYVIEKYNLLNGKREAVREVTGIKEIMAEVSRRKKFAPVYDFKMLKDF
jgi:hypothetical protein